MQHDLTDQLRALRADLQAAEEKASRARFDLTQRIQYARAGAKEMRPLKDFLEANDRANGALHDARRALERFKRLHPETR
ncbi:MAG TPA: hypothetical protein VGN52_20910 [Burkholderiales bacterium]